MLTLPLHTFCRDLGNPSQSTVFLVDVENKSSEAKGSVALRGGGESATVAGVESAGDFSSSTACVCVTECVCARFPSMGLCLDVS